MGLFSKKKPVEIDLREPTPFVFGFPTRCPACNGRGYLDHIDPFKREQFEHCKDCDAKWVLTEDEVASFHA